MNVKKTFTIGLLLLVATVLQGQDKGSGKLKGVGQKKDACTEYQNRKSACPNSAVEGPLADYEQHKNNGPYIEARTKQYCPNHVKATEGTNQHNWNACVNELKQKQAGWCSHKYNSMEEGKACPSSGGKGR